MTFNQKKIEQFDRLWEKYKQEWQTDFWKRKNKDFLSTALSEAREDERQKFVKVVTNNFDKTFKTYDYDNLANDVLIELEPELLSNLSIRKESR